MFWGLTLEPGKRYAQKVEHTFHISMAALDPSSTDNDPVSIMVEVEKQDFILCNLSKKIPQQQMKHEFSAGEVIAFFTQGKGTVHLTGYIKLISEESEDMEEQEVEEISEQESEEESSQAKVNEEEDEEDSDDDDDDDDEDSVKEVGDTSEEEEEAPSLGSRISHSSLQITPKSGIKEKGKNKIAPIKWTKEKISTSTPKQIVQSPQTVNEKMILGHGGEKSVKKKAQETPTLHLEKKKTQETPTKQTEKKKAQETLKNVMTPQTPGRTDEEEGDDMEVTSPVTNGVSDDATSSAKKKKKKRKKQKRKAEAGDMESNPGSAEKKQKTQGSANTPKTPKTPKTPATPMKRTLPGGLMLEDIRVGGGAEARSGQSVSVYYVGRLKQNNKQFDSNTQEPGFKFHLGTGEVIKGWDIGIQGMKVGGKRKIICPAHFGYGQKGSPPVIPPNSTLVFEVDLKAVK